jgi:hypothetical protein
MGARAGTVAEGPRGAYIRTVRRIVTPLVVGGLLVLLGVARGTERLLPTYAEAPNPHWGVFRGVTPYWSRGILRVCR